MTAGWMAVTAEQVALCSQLALLVSVTSTVQLSVQLSPCVLDGCVAAAAQSQLLALPLAQA